MSKTTNWEILLKPRKGLTQAYNTETHSDMEYCDLHLICTPNSECAIRYRIPDKGVNRGTYSVHMHMRME